MKDSSKFRIGLDVHGVINSMPDFFSFLTKAITSAGGEVHILTGATADGKLISELESYDIKYDALFSVYDHMISNGYERLGLIEFPDGTKQYKFNSDVWDKVKGDYCDKNNISLHLDDTLNYNNFFKTPFARLWCHQNTKNEGSHIDI